MKIFLSAIMLLFIASTVWGGEKKKTNLDCVNSQVDSIMLMRSLKPDQIKVDQEFLICLNQLDGPFYPTLFDVPDDLLLARYNFILEKRAQRRK